VAETETRYYLWPNGQPCRKRTVGGVPRPAETYAGDGRWVEDSDNWDTEARPLDPSDAQGLIREWDRRTT
jgi:hypothetical protein